jgi:hypothetical protein
MAAAHVASRSAWSVKNFSLVAMLSRHFRKIAARNPEVFVCDAGAVSVAVIIADLL